MSRVERLARCYTALMPEWASELATFQQPIELNGLSHTPENTRPLRAEDRIPWGLEPSPALYFSQDAEARASVRVEQSEAASLRDPRGLRHERLILCEELLNNSSRLER